MGSSLVVIVFYTSGHGFGHASRDIEVISALARRRPDVRVVVRTSVPRWFFEQSARVPIDLQPAEVDSGVAQIDGLRLDEDETAHRAARFYADFDRRVADEAAQLRDLQASAIVGDVPPLAFAAARQAGLPSIALANFTWDWIYAAYPQFEALAPGVLALLRRVYAGATRALRLPFHGGFESMAAIRDIPLVARRSARGRYELRRAIELEEDRPIVLASFGAYGAGLRYNEIARRAPFTLIVTEHEMADEPDARRLRRFTSEELAARGVRYGDLVAAADIVVTKPGYGIVSECVANGTALLYTSRGRFREHDVFVAEMPELVRCRYLPQEDLTAGRWAEAVTGVLEQPAPHRRLETTGSDVAAEEILKIADCRVQIAD